ncbi:MAG: hypothetical protein D6725_17495, partial [Planctomycetota bacterium]
MPPLPCGSSVRQRPAAPKTWPKRCRFVATAEVFPRPDPRRSDHRAGIHAEWRDLGVPFWSVGRAGSIVCRDKERPPTGEAARSAGAIGRKTLGRHFAGREACRPSGFRCAVRRRLLRIGCG